MDSFILSHTKQNLSSSRTSSNSTVLSFLSSSRAFISDSNLAIGPYPDSNMTINSLRSRSLFVGLVLLLSTLFLYSFLPHWLSGTDPFDQDCQPSHFKYL